MSTTRSVGGALATLFLGMFVLGSGELLVVGLLNLIAADLQVSIVSFLESVTGISGTLISLFLLAYGVATAVGSFAGGRFADQNAARTLIVGAIGVAVSLLLYLVGTIAMLVALALLAFGLFDMGMVPSMQYRAVSLAGPGGQLASSLPASAANVGIALGSYAGGVAIGTFTASSAVITGLIIAVISIPVAWAASFLKPPVIADATEPAVAADVTPSPRNHGRINHLEDTHEWLAA